MGVASVAVASAPAAPAAMFGGNSADLTAAEHYAQAHGGGAIGVESQSAAAAAILANNGNVAGLGGFSGRESTVTPQWLAMEVRNGRLRWILADGQSGFGGPGGDTRQGSTAAMAIAEKVGTKVTFTSNGTTVTMYDLQGKSSAILRGGPLMSPRAISLAVAALAALAGAPAALADSTQSSNWAGYAVHRSASRSRRWPAPGPSRRPPAAVAARPIRQSGSGSAATA